MPPNTSFTSLNFLAQNLVGVKNLYKIVSDAHVNHFYRATNTLSPTNSINLGKISSIVGLSFIKSLVIPVNS